MAKVLDLGDGRRIVYNKNNHLKIEHTMDGYSEVGFWLSSNDLKALKEFIAKLEHKK